MGRLLCELLSDAAEPRALLALMLLHDARRAARITAEGEMVLLEDQDRSLWDREQIEEGLGLVESALRAAAAGPYALQAAIAALHVQASSAAQVDWKQIAALYTLLLSVRPSPVVELNRAVAVAMDQGPERGLVLMDALVSSGQLHGYHLLWAARADLLRRLERWAEAAADYRRALGLVANAPERTFLARRLRNVEIRLE